MNDTRLKVTEIFLSIQGESRTVGIPTVFIRLTGCPLRCHYCDTAYAFYGGKRLTLTDILKQVAHYQVNHVLLTGGEPLAQPEALTLLKQLCNRHYTVSLETSGALDVSRVDPRVIKVVDIKTPSSGEVSRNLLRNLSCLNKQDQLKFVISDRADYEWACAFARTNNLLDQPQPAELLFSPAHGTLSPTHLAEWILADRLPVRLQVQLHKYLWGDKPGH